jgi:drug/metabolite transporter (DMT)-like permease
MDIRALLMGLAFAFMWSSAFTSARTIVQDAPPLAALSLRFLLSGLIGVAIAKALGQSWKLTSGQWRAVLVFGLCQNALYLGLNFVAMQTVQASLASIIASTMPLMVAGAGWLFLKDRLPVQGVIGLMLGIGGVVLIMGARFDGNADAVGMALCVLGAMALSIATLAMRGASSGGNLLMIVGLQMLVGSVILGVVSAFTEALYVNLSRSFPALWQHSFGSALWNASVRCAHLRFTFSIRSLASRLPRYYLVRRSERWTSLA